MKKYFKVIFAVIIILLLIYFLSKVDFPEIWRILKEINLFFFSLAVLTYLLALLTFNLRNIFALEWVMKPNFLFLLKTLFAAFFINTITPGMQIGGEPVRAYYLNKKHRKPFSKIFGAISADRFIHGLVSFIFIVFSVLFLLTFIPVPEKLKLIFQVFLLLTFLGVAVILIFRLSKTKFNIGIIFKRFKWLTWLNPLRKNKELWKKGGFQSFVKSFKKTITNRQIFIAGMVLSFIHWILIYLVSYLLFISLGFRIDFFLVIAVVSIGSFVGDFSPSPGGAGFVEGFMILLYSIIGINFAVAFIVSLLSRVISYFFSLVIGGISLIHLESSFK